MADERVVYDNNEVVWAKIRGYPWWPAYISGSIKSSNPPGGIEYIVNFYGDTSQQPVDNIIDSARLTPDKVAKFQPNYAEFEQKARSSKKLAKSVLIAEEALKSQGINYEFEKRPGRRPSKAHSKLSSDAHSIDHMESQIADDQNRSTSKAMKPSPEKKEVPSIKESPKAKPQAPKVEPMPSPARKQSKQQSTKEEAATPVVIATLPAQKESKSDKAVERQKESRPKGGTRETKEAKEKEAKAQASVVSKPNPKAEEVQDEPPLKKQPRSVQPKLDKKLSRMKIKRSASKGSEKKNREEPQAVLRNKAGPIVQPVNEQLLLLTRLRECIGRPTELMNYLASIDINVGNVKEILDCQVVDVLHGVKDPLAKELLKKLKATLISRYFEDEPPERPNAKKPNADKVEEVVERDELRNKTRQKAQGILRKHNSLSEQQATEAASRIQELISQRDPTSGLVYRRLALQVLSRLKSRSLSLEEAFKQLATPN